MKQFSLDKKTTKQIIIDQLATDRPELKNVKITFSSRDNSDGPFRAGGILTTVKLSGTEMLGDIPTTVSEDLSISDIKGFISEYFAEHRPELRVGEVVFNDGESIRSVGYGMDEHDEKTIYCKGVTVTAFEKDENKISRDTSKERGE